MRSQVSKMNTILKLLEEGWEFKPMNKGYAIIPPEPDVRRKWASEWAPHDFRGITIYVPHWS